MSFSQDNYRRALNRFLDDNPGVDIDVAIEEFNDIYNKGLYKLDDAYEKAENLYQEVSNSEDRDEAVAILSEAIKVCPYHYDSRILKTVLETDDDFKVIEALEEIREEYKNWLLTKNIDVNNLEDDIWNHLEGRAYIRLLSVLVELCLKTKKYNEARKYAEMEYRLDFENQVDSLFDYLICILYNHKYQLAIKLITELDNLSGRYLLIVFYCYACTGQNKYAYRVYRWLLKYNPYYCVFICGMLDIDSDEINDILDMSEFKRESYEEAVYFINKIADFVSAEFPKLDGYYAEYFPKMINALIALPPEDISIITILLSQEDGIDAKKLLDLLTITDCDIEMQQLKRRLTKLINKRYVLKHENLYYPSNLSFFIAKAAVNDGEDDEDDFYDLDPTNNKNNNENSES